MRSTRAGLRLADLCTTSLRITLTHIDWVLEKKTSLLAESDWVRSEKLQCISLIASIYNCCAMIMPLPTGRR
jgi:hypothetical protein